MKRSVRFSAMAASVLLLMGVSATGASAEVGDCTSQGACTWVDQQYGGLYTDIKGDVGNYNNVYFAYTNSKGANDKASSAVGNGARCKVRFYQHANSQGIYLELSRPGLAGAIYRDPYLPNGGGYGPYSTRNLNDMISSHEWFSCA